MANVFISYLSRFYSISSDFIFIEVIFSFDYRESIVPRLAITWICFFVCAYKPAYIFMRLRKVKWLLFPNRIWRISSKCTVCSFIMNTAEFQEKEKEKKFGVEKRKDESHRIGKGIFHKHSLVYNSSPLNNGFLWNVIFVHYRKSLMEKVLMMLNYCKYCRSNTLYVFKFCCNNLYIMINYNYYNFTLHGVFILYYQYYFWNRI